MAADVRAQYKCAVRTDEKSRETIGRETDIFYDRQRKRQLNRDVIRKEIGEKF